jgi:dihydropteroate synthase
VGIADDLGDADEIADLDVEVGLLLHLSHQRVGEVLAKLYPATGDRPQALGRFAPALNHQQRAVRDDDGADGDLRELGSGHGPQANPSPAIRLSSCAMKRQLVHARGHLPLDHCLVMGIVNRTPDSFYDGGRMDLETAVEHSLSLVDAGADVLDIGAIKAGPGEPVTEDEEFRRLIPLVAAVAEATEVPISVETARHSVAHAAIEVGAAIVNDVSELSDQKLAPICAATGAALILMHNGGQIRGRPRHPEFDDVIGDVLRRWKELAESAGAAGVHPERLMVDPGLDFGKTTYHSLELMARLDELTSSPWPVLVAPSRKDVVGESLDLPPDQRLEGTLALVALSVAAGVAAVRVHDVRPAVRVTRMTETVLRRRDPAAPLRGLWD